jgi:hypothetical protein
MTEQQNNRRSNVTITIDNVTKTMTEWAAHFGVSYAVVKERRARGVSGIALFAASPRKTYSRLIEIDGVSKTITQWAKHYGVTYQQMWKRFNTSKLRTYEQHRTTAP